MTDLFQKDRLYIWHPYTQMKDYAQRDILLIDKASGLLLEDINGKKYYDTISSWWCILHGHNHPTIKKHMHRQLDKLEQVLLAGTSHEPAILLAEHLVGLTPAPLSKVFYSDNGSTACEVALKMSLQYWQHKDRKGKKEFIGLERGYHGDTIGTMSLGGVEGFHGAFDHLMFDSHRIPSPYCYRCPMQCESDTCKLECLLPLKDLLQSKSESIAALIIEPLIQAAGGMVVYPSRYLVRLAELCKKYGVHLIFDEVATGFGRTGKMFALEHVNITPDFLCLSKGLTGGYLPMAVTMTTDDVYQAFYSDYTNNKTFYHGHTFTGNPLAASAALGSIEVFEEEDPFKNLKSIIPSFHQKMQRFCSLDWVGDLRTLGMIAALELVKDKGSKEPFTFQDRVGWKIYLEGLNNGIILRPLGNIVYLWLPISTTETELDDILDRTWQVLSNPANINGLK